MHVGRLLSCAVTNEVASRQVKDLRRLLSSGSRDNWLQACTAIVDILNSPASLVRVEFTLLAAALIKCVKVSKDPRQLSLLATLSESMAQRLEEGDSTDVSALSPKRLGETMRAIGVAGRSPPTAVARLRDLLRPHLLATIPDMGPLQLRHVTWAINKLSLPWDAEINMAINTMLDRVGLASVGFGELATFVWAVSRMGGCNERFTGAVAVDWAGRVGRPGVSAEAHALVLSSLGATARNQPEVVRLFDVCSSKLDLGNFKTSELASVLWAFGHMTASTLDSRVWKICIAKFDESTIRQCPLHSIGNAFWAAGSVAQSSKSDSQLPLAFVHHLAELIVNTGLDGFTSGAISSIAWAVGLASDGDPWVERVFRHLLSNEQFPIDGSCLAEAWKPLEIATVLSSLTEAKLLAAFPAFTSAATEVVVDNIRGWRPTAQNILAVSQISNAQWSTGQGTMMPIVDWAVANVDALTPQSESRILWATARMFESSALREPPASVVAFVSGLADQYRSRDGHQYQQQDVALLVWALGTLRLSHYELEERCCVLARGMLMDGRIDSRHLAMVLWGITSNSHRSQPAIDLIRTVVDRVESSTFRPRKADVTIVIWSMAVFDFYSQKALRNLLEALARAGPVSSAAPRTEQGASLIRLHRSLLWARVCHGFEPTASEEAQLMQIARRQRAPGGGLVSSSTLQWEIRSELQRVLPVMAPAVILRDEYELPPPLEGIFVDLALLDAEGRVLAIIEVDGYSHFSQLIGAGRLAVLQYNGNTELSRRILSKAGYKVFSISTVEWNNTQRHRRGEFLADLLRDVAALRVEEELFHLQPPTLLALDRSLLQLDIMASTSSAAVRRCALSRSARQFATAAATVATRPRPSTISDPFQLRKVLLDASRHKKKSDVLSICQQAALPPPGPSPTTHRLQLLATSLHRLVKHFHNTQPDLVDALCEELSEALQSTSITINEVADSLWSIGMAGGATPSRARLLTMLRPSITPLLDSASSSQLSNVACAIAKLDLDWHEEVRHVMLQCRTGLGVGSTAGGVVSNICWAAARTGVRDEAFLREAAATWLSRSVATVPASATAMIFWSLGKLAPDAPYVTELFSKAREHPGLLADFGIRECASVLSGYAYVATEPPHDEIFKVAMASLRAAQRGRVSTQTIASSCWASATLTKQHGEVVKSSAACLVGSLMGLVLEARQGGFTPQEVSNILWSAALLLSRDEVIASAEYLLPHTPERILGYTAQDLAVCMAALAQTGGLEALENSFVNSALQRVRESIYEWPADATHIHAVGQLAWSIAGRPFRDVQPLLEWAAERGANTEAFVKLLWCAASTPEAQQGSLWDSADLLKFLDASAKGPDCVFHFNQQELALVAWSLATLRLSHQVLEEQCCHEARELLLGPGISSAHLSMLLWGLASNCHSSNYANELIEEVVAQVCSRKYRFVAADSFHVAWSLAALDVFGRRVLDVLLSAAATAELDGVALQKINQVSLWSSSHGFDPSPMVAGLFQRAAESARSEATVVDSAFQDQVTECIRRAMGSNDDYRVVPELDLSHLGCPGVIVDLAVVRHEVTDGLQHHHQQQQLVLIIEANGPSHYVRSVGKESGSSHTLCGKAVMRRNSLRRLGYPVEEICFTHWKRLDRNSRQEYVESIVKARLLPQEKFLQSM